MSREHPEWNGMPDDWGLTWSDDDDDDPSIGVEEYDDCPGPTVDEDAPTVGA